MNMGLKSQPNLKRHSDERLVNNSYQNTQWVRRSKSQTESEQNLFSEKKNVLAFLPCIFFLWFVYGRASLPRCKQHMKVHVWIFSAQYGRRIKIAESRAKFHKFR